MRLKAKNLLKDLSNSNVEHSAYLGILFWSFILFFLMGKSIGVTVLLAYAGLGLYRVTSPEKRLSRLIPKVPTIFSVLAIISAGFFAAFYLVDFNENASKTTLIACFSLALALTYQPLTKLLLIAITKQNRRDFRKWSGFILFIPLIATMLFAPFCIAVTIHWLKAKRFPFFAGKFIDAAYESRSKRENHSDIFTNTDDDPMFKHEPTNIYNSFHSRDS